VRNVRPYLATPRSKAVAKKNAMISMTGIWIAPKMITRTTPDQNMPELSWRWHSRRRSSSCRPPGCSMNCRCCCTPRAARWRPLPPPPRVLFAFSTPLWLDSYVRYCRGWVRLPQRHRPGRTTPTEAPGPAVRLRGAMTLGHRGLDDGERPGRQLDDDHPVLGVFRSLFQSCCLHVGQAAGVTRAGGGDRPGPGRPVEG